MNLPESPHLSTTSHAINWYKFGFKQSITKDTLHEEKINFSTVSRLLTHGSFWNSTPIIQCTCATKGVSLVVNDQ